MEPIVAIFFDCDGTLSQDTTDFLLRESGVDTGAFWKKTDSMVETGWDPPLAYMTNLLELLDDGAISDLTADRMREIGSQIPLFDGLPGMFSELRTMVKRRSALKEAGVELEYYLVSGGFLKVIEGMAIADYMRDIFACDFDFDPKSGLPFRIKSSVTFTEKTKFVFAVNKGISGDELRRSPYRVNDSIREEERRVPFDQMVYVGDGPSDIPCFSLIRVFGGRGIGVYKKGKAKKGYELSEAERITAGPFIANYSKGSSMRTYLEEAVLNVGYNIATKRELTFRRSPQH